MKRRTGFTLIEILVVIGIIMVLIGIVVVGYSRVADSGRIRECRVTLENLRGMVQELDAKAGLNARQPQFMWFNNAAYTTPGFNVWKDGNPTDGTAAPEPDPVISPGNVSRDMPNRLDSDAVRNTQQVMAILASMPQMRAAMSNVSTAKINLPNLPDPTGSSGVIVYDESQIPLLLDPWGNPFIFVPGGGLCGNASTPMYVGGKAGDSNAKLIVAVPGPNELGPIASPDARSFWASAGPDGDFSTGDDNIYSF